MDCVGLIPAAGRGTRLGEQSLSKEVLPLPEECGPPGEDRRVSDCLLEGFRRAGIEQVFWVIREGKWDIPRHYGDGRSRDMAFAWVMMDAPWGTPFSLDQAWPFIKDKTVALGFPDIQFRPLVVYARLLEQLRCSDADVMLAAFPADRPDKFDMLDIAGQGRVLEIQIKPPRTELQYCWANAVWKPAFSRYMHQFIQQALDEFDLSRHPEIYVGTVLQMAMAEGFRVEAVRFPEGRVLDLGTPEDFSRVAGFEAGTGGAT